MTTVERFQQRIIRRASWFALGLVFPALVAGHPVWAIGIITGYLLATLNFTLMAGGIGRALRLPARRAALLVQLTFLLRFLLLAIVLTLFLRWQTGAGLGLAAGFVTIIAAIVSSLVVPFAPEERA